MLTGEFDGSDRDYFFQVVGAALRLCTQWTRPYPPPNYRLQRTVMDKVPRSYVRCPAAEPGR